MPPKPVQPRESPHVRTDSASKAESGVEIRDSGAWLELHVNGNPFFVNGATFFYERIPRDLWEISLERHAELGINTIHLSIPWSWHQPKPGTFDFDGHTNPRRDLRALLQLISSLGFKLIVSLGPDLGSEWRHNALPEWLTPSAPEGREAVHDWMAAIR
ncbi:MAG: beta-galactosidase, partial [Acidobacteria bacterium]|nr:beta-galactosidase [Acidobacteriota bacterium]